MNCKKKKNMTANKEKNVPIIFLSKKKKNVPIISQAQRCCCMCGDSGLTHELFHCNVCHFRSQHRYCSNLYPKAESYEVCNWCLNQKVVSMSQNSSNSSPSCNKDTSEEDDSKNKRKAGDYNHGSNTKASQRNNNLKLQSPTGKPKSTEKPPPCTTRKRIISNRRLEEKLRTTTTTTTKSKDRSNGGHITRHVFRNKVRRYKLLDEVSS